MKKGFRIEAKCCKGNKISGVVDLVDGNLIRIISDKGQSRWIRRYSIDKSFRPEECPHCGESFFVEENSYKNNCPKCEKNV